MTEPDRHQALLRRGRTLQIASVPTRPPGRGELRVQLSFVGVCGTDLQILNGSRPDTAEVLGHEGVGQVVQAGPAAALALGESVVFNPAAQLSSGRILGHNTSGLFQKFITVDSRAVEEGLVVAASDYPPTAYAALAEPLASVIYGHQLITIRVRELRTAVVFGAGPVGLLAATYLGGLGVRVLIVHPTQARLRTVAALGIVSPTAAVTLCNDLAERLLQLNDGDRPEAALVCTTRAGAPAALQHALEVVKDRGCIDLITNYPEGAVAPLGVNTALLRAVRAENVNGLPLGGRYLVAGWSGHSVALTGHRGTSPEHLLQAMRVLRLQSAAYARLITHVTSLAQAGPAIQSLSEPHTRILGGRECIKLVIDMGAER